MHVIKIYIFLMLLNISFVVFSAEASSLSDPTYALLDKQTISSPSSSLRELCLLAQKRFPSSQSQVYLCQTEEEQFVIKESLNALEYKILQSLSHPGIIKPQAFSFEKRRSYFKMKYYQTDLFSLCLKEERFSRVTIKSYLKQMAEILVYLHSLGRSHGDISCENFLLDAQEEELVLIDFEDSQTGNFGQILGRKENYVVPEFYQGNSRIDLLKADIWNLGIVLFIMLFKSPAFDKTCDQNESYLYFKEHGLRKYLKNVFQEEDYDKEIFEILELMLKVNPKERINASDLLEKVGRL